MVAKPSAEGLVAVQRTANAGIFNILLKKISIGTVVGNYRKTTITNKLI